MFIRRVRTVRLWGREAGLEFVFSAPLVRSSYNAAHVFEQIKVTR
jgi:hypothetical protein